MVTRTMTHDNDDRARALGVAEALTDGSRDAVTAFLRADMKDAARGLLEYDGKTSDETYRVALATLGALEAGTRGD